MKWGSKCDEGTEWFVVNEEIARFEAVVNVYIILRDS